MEQLCLKTRHVPIHPPILRLIMPRANYPMAINRPSYQNRGKLYTQHAVLMRCMRQDGNPGMENGPGGTWRDLLFQAKSLDVCLTNELVFCF